MGHCISHENHSLAKNMAMQEMEYSETLIQLSEATIGKKRKEKSGKTTVVGKALNVSGT